MCMQKLEGNLATSKAFQYLPILDGPDPRSRVVRSVAWAVARHVKLSPQPDCWTRVRPCFAAAPGHWDFRISNPGPGSRPSLDPASSDSSLKPYCASHTPEELWAVGNDPASIWQIAEVRLMNIGMRWYHIL